MKHATSIVFYIMIFFLLWAAINCIYSGVKMLEYVSSHSNIFVSGFVAFFCILQILFMFGTIGFFIVRRTKK